MCENIKIKTLKIAEWKKLYSSSKKKGFCGLTKCGQTKFVFRSYVVDMNQNSTNCTFRFIWSAWEPNDLFRFIYSTNEPKKDILYYFNPPPSTESNKLLIIENFSGVKDKAQPKFWFWFWFCFYFWFCFCPIKQITLFVF